MKSAARLAALVALGSLFALPVVAQDIHLGTGNEPGNGYDPKGNGWALHSHLLKNAGGQQTNQHASAEPNKYQQSGTSKPNDLTGSTK